MKALKLVAALGFVIVLVPVMLFVGIGGSPPPLPAGADQPTPLALADIPANYLALYESAAAACPGLSWTILAAIGKVESDHGRSTLPGVQSGANSAGAEGPMQFLPATFAAYALPGHPNIYDPADAIPAAGNMLCKNGAGSGPAGLYAAIFAYNHADWYVQEVEAQAAKYGQAAVLTGANPAATQTVINYAAAQLGKPYLWGGAGPDSFDCSGLTMRAFQTVGINMPHNAYLQWAETNAHIIDPKALQPGDLLYWATNPADPPTIHHVALYIGNGQMIEAYATGYPVRIAPARTSDPEYIGATRPLGDSAYGTVKVAA